MSALAAHAGEGVDTEGARLHLVLDSTPGPGGDLRGALNIQLKPGWKTYWRDPGDAGVPPSISATASGRDLTVRAEFPAPGRHKDSYGSWAGYDHSVTLPFTVSAASGAIDFAVFLGVCEQVCVPVQASFRVDPAKSGPREREQVAKAFAALPGPARPGFQVTGAQLRGETIAVTVEAPGSADDLFVAGEDGISLGVPVPMAGGFSVPVLEPLPEGALPALHYTLTASGNAVSGVLDVAR